MSEASSMDCRVGRDSAAPLSGTQNSALEWIKANGPAERKAYRAAGYTSKTINSLMDRGLVERKQEFDPRWRIVYVAKSPTTQS